jgi:copper(I)-binding protein
MKTFPALGAGVLIVVGAIALKMSARQPGQLGNDARRTVADRVSESSRTAAEHAVSAADSSKPRKETSAPFVPETPTDESRFYAQHCTSTLAALRLEPDLDARERMLTDLAAWMEGRDPTTGLDFLTRQEPSEIIADLQERLLQLWAGKDAPAAATAALKIGGHNAREALETVLRTWAEERLNEAIAWVNQMPEGAEKQTALLSLALTAARTEPETAVALASDLPSSPERDEMILHAASQWAASDPASASAWAREIQESSLRDQLLTTIATVLGDSDPIAAATLAIETLPPGKAQDDAVVGIVQRWAQNDPNAAAAWVRAFPEGAVRSAAVENIVKLWADKDARPAGEWLNSLPPSAFRNNGVRAYSEQIAPSSPREAAVWAGTITDPQMRIAQLENIAKIWMQSDSVAATAWLSQMPFSQEFRSRIFRR